MYAGNEMTAETTEDWYVQPSPDNDNANVDSNLAVSPHCCPTIHVLKSICFPSETKLCASAPSDGDILRQMSGSLSPKPHLWLYPVRSKFGIFALVGGYFREPGK